VLPAFEGGREKTPAVTRPRSDNAGLPTTQQAHYDLAQVHADRIKLKRLELA
jgi:hypothetical protein